jgi:uncharacterized protein with GYD domain
VVFEMSMDVREGIGGSFLLRRRAGLLESAGHFSLEADMPRYMIKASYTAEGVKGLAKAGGTARRAAVQKMLEGMGGTLESFYFAYGADDVFAVFELPDAASAIAAGLAVNASGAVRVSTTPLITPEEVDAACKKLPEYRAPGA